MPKPVLRYPDVPGRWDPTDWTRWGADLIRRLNNDIIDLRRPANKDDQQYSITNVVTDRSYDANSTTVDELADVLGTLIEDLKTKGLLQ